MARKRMFDLEVINQESFYDLPMESKALYFLLGMEADDEGFVSPKKILRLYGGTEDGIKVLIAKGYIIPFKSGVVVITDWNRNNWLDSRRTKKTIYQTEKSQLIYNKDSEKYELNSLGLANAKQMLRENSIEENSIEENSIDIYSPAKAEPHIIPYEEKCEKDNIPYKEICEYLNMRTNSNYRSSSKKTRELIKARFNDGYTLEDFKTVIDKKSVEWMNDKDFSKYLRPETLFGTKFEGYLNQQVQSKELTTSDLKIDLTQVFKKKG